MEGRERKRPRRKSIDQESIEFLTKAYRGYGFRVFPMLCTLILSVNIALKITKIFVLIKQTKFYLPKFFQYFLIQENASCTESTRTVVATNLQVLSIQTHIAKPR
jgi:hypothetical protein